jgi:hypothetical protein
VHCTAGVSEVSALIAMMMGLSPIGVNVAMFLMAMRRNRIRNRLRVGARLRHHPRKLGDQEQGNQQADKPRYGSEQIHRRIDTLRWKPTPFWPHRVHPSMPRTVCGKLRIYPPIGALCARSSQNSPKKDPTFPEPMACAVVG